MSKYKNVFSCTLNTITSFLDASKGSTCVWQNAVEELGHCNTHYLNSIPFRLLKIKISFAKYVPRSYNIFCKQVNDIQFRQWILKWPNCFTVFLPSTCTTTLSKYGTDEYDNSVLKRTLYSLWHVCMCWKVTGYCNKSYLQTYFNNEQRAFQRRFLRWM